MREEADRVGHRIVADAGDIGEIERRRLRDRASRRRRAGRRRDPGRQRRTGPARADRGPVRSISLAMPDAQALSAGARKQEKTSGAPGAARVRMCDSAATGSSKNITPWREAIRSKPPSSAQTPASAVTKRQAPSSPARSRAAATKAGERSMPVIVRARQRFGKRQAGPPRPAADVEDARRLDACQTRHDRRDQRFVYRREGAIGAHPLLGPCLADRAGPVGCLHDDEAIRDLRTTEAAVDRRIAAWRPLPFRAHACSCAGRSPAWRCAAVRLQASPLSAPARRLPFRTPWLPHLRSCLRRSTGFWSSTRRAYPIASAPARSTEVDEVDRLTRFFSSA